MEEKLPNCPKCNHSKGVVKCTVKADGVLGTHYCYSSRNGCGEYFNVPAVSVSLTKPVALPADEPSGIDKTLAERGSRYGTFSGHAEITQSLKAVMSVSKNWFEMSDDKREALEMIQHKIGRILNGDPNYADSWHDIIGYAKLIEETL